MYGSELDEYIVSSATLGCKMSGWDLGVKCLYRAREKRGGTQNLQGREGAIHVSKQYIIIGVVTIGCQ